MVRRLLLVSFVEPWSIGEGIGAPSLFETVKGYADAGWSITFVTSEKRYLRGGGHERNIDISLPAVEVVRFHIPAMQKYLGARIQAKIERAFWFGRYGKIILDRLLNERKFDLVYAYEEAAIAAVSALDVRNSFRTPTLHRFQGTILGGRYKDRLLCLRKYESWMALRAKADMYVMTNDGTFGDRALKYWNSDVTDTNLLFVRNGIDTNIRQLVKDRTLVLQDYGIEPGGIYLLTVSRLADWKRVDRAIRAIKALAGQWPSLKLIVCGDGEARDDLEALAIDLGIFDRVSFVGAQPRKRVAELLNCCDIFLSLYDISNCGNPLFEAMLCGKPIVTLDNGSTGDVISDGVNGRLLAISDEESVVGSNIVDAIEELLGKEDLRSKLGAGASSWACQNLTTWKARIEQEISWVEARIGIGEVR